MFRLNSGLLKRAQPLLRLYGFGLILVIISALRLHQLNYNTPFTDEAIYVVIGKLGLFQWDWSSYAANNWMAGSLFAYPPLTALAYTSGGIIGSRLLNVIFGILTVVTLSHTSALLVSPQKTRLAQLATALIAGFSGVAIFVSRLATYDMPAFFFFFQSLYHLLKAHQPNSLIGRHYFLSALTLTLAIFTKIVILIYAPFLFLYALYPVIRFRRPHRHYYFWRYYALPLIIMASAYLIVQGHGLLIYFLTHRSSEFYTYPEIIEGVGMYLLPLIPLYILSSFILIFRRRIKLWATFTLAALLIIAFHAFTHRYSTFDKHLFFTHAFVALLSAVAFSYLPDLSARIIRPLFISFSIICLGFYIARSLPQAYAYGSDWPNSRALVSYLQSVIKPQDYLLSIDGPVTMLATYSQIHPLKTTTFDWNSYQGFEGEEAYRRAIKDAHYNFIIIYSDEYPAGELHQSLEDLVKTNLDSSYTLAFHDTNYLVYQRVYD